MPVTVVGRCDSCGGSFVVSWSPFPIAVVGSLCRLCGRCHRSLWVGRGLAILGHCKMVGEALRSSIFEMSDLMRPLQHFAGHAPAYMASWSIRDCRF